MTAIETLLKGLFDYAGLYPPANLSLRSAAHNYLEYSSGGYAPALGRFIVNLDRLEEFRTVAGDSLEDYRLNVVASEEAHWALLIAQIRAGLPVVAIEVKCCDPHEIERIANRIPRGLEIYFEVPMNPDNDSLRAICTVGARAKIRMGGVVAEAIPQAADVAQMLKTLSDSRIPFKATAGLHHPLRSTQFLTYEPQSHTGIMHGFVNLSAASTLFTLGAP